MKRLILLLPLFFFLVCLSAQVRGQKKKFSSYSKYSDRQPTVEVLLDSANSCYESDPKKALSFLEQALTSSIQNKDQQGEGGCYLLLGKINYNQGLFDQAASNFRKSGELFYSRNETKEAQQWLAKALEASGDVPGAELLYEKMLKVAGKENQVDDIIFCRNGLARIYKKNQKFNLALEQLTEVLKLEERRKNQKGIITTNNLIGSIYEEQKKHKEALDYYTKSEELAIQTKDEKFINSSTRNIKEVYRKENRVDEELLLREKSIDFNLKNNNLDEVNEDYLEIAKLYLEQKAADKAIPYLEKSIGLSTQLNSPERTGYAYKSLSEAYAQKNNYLLALNNYRNYVQLTDSAYKQKERKLATLLEYNEELGLRAKKIEFLEKDLDLNSKAIDLLRAEQRTQKLIIYSLSGGIVLIFAASFTIYRISRKRRIANQLLALKSLRSQMNPHFIFNALNSVNSYIARSDEKAANKYLSDFSRLMREVMETSQHDFISFSTEVRILELYLNLEHSRFSDKFDYTFNIDPAIDTDGISIPPMLIQPYIENAVWHGLRYRNEKGNLKVSVRKEGRQIIVEVEDNGIGRKQSQELKTANQKTRISTGLKNIETRIRIINEVHHMNIKVSVSDLDAETGQGTVVKLHIPLGKNED